MAIHDLEAVTVTQLAKALDTGELTSRSLVEGYLQRIHALDPPFGSIRLVLSDAMAQADASDARRAAGKARGPLEGVPVAIKDNVDVAGIPTTAGALALEHSVPGQDAFLISRLREAGAVILAKTNLSELANFLTDGMPSGYSSLGGQVLNPYDTSITPSGSSSGSAAAVALGLATVAVGTETDGSITSPSEHQSVVGCKPTVGLVSRSGIVPISASQDTAGPIAKTVADAAELLAGLAGTDPADPATKDAGSALADGRLVGWNPELGLGGIRLGVVQSRQEQISSEQHFDPDVEARAVCHHAALDALRAAGADLVDVSLVAPPRDDEQIVLHYEFAAGMDAYLGSLGPSAPIRSLVELQRWNLAHADQALKFGQTHIDKATALRGEDTAQYRRARSRDLLAVSTALEAALTPDLDALVFPGAEGCSLAARAGWPSVVVPAGYTSNSRRPVGIMFMARPWHDGHLLSMANAFEQVHSGRRAPREINPAAFRRSVWIRTD